MQGSRWRALISGDKEDPRTELAALFGGDVPSAGQPPEPALAWALGVLRGQDAGEVTTEVEAIRCLRGADPRLALKPAAFLAKHAMQRR